jgi:hypothetical protein
MIGSWRRRVWAGFRLAPALVGRHRAFVRALRGRAAILPATARRVVLRRALVPVAPSGTVASWRAIPIPRGLTGGAWHLIAGVPAVALAVPARAAGPFTIARWTRVGPAFAVLPRRP